MGKAEMGHRGEQEAGGTQRSVQSRDATRACLIFVPDQFFPC